MSIVNNQIGFTTVPAHAYSGLYCTDVAKSIQAPILHVNGDEPEAVVFCARMAAEFRMQFGTDIVLDIVCYRRHGHNETDEPAFTQPIMYRAITRAARPRATLYAERLAAEGVVPRRAVAGDVGRVPAPRSRTPTRRRSPTSPNKADWLEGHWSGLKQADAGRGAAGGDRRRSTASSCRQVGARALRRRPTDFDLNPKIARQLEAKRAMIESGEGIDWATGEALAFGTPAAGRPSRAPVRRGLPARHVQPAPRGADRPDQPERIRAAEQHRARPGEDRDLQLAAVRSRACSASNTATRWPTRSTLVLWEAQFGDFANGAQVIIDQFLASGETKWLRMSGLTLLLPHGYEGQGPEHSSARLERYLQLCAERNMAVCNLTTPANYFHALRRQLKRNFRKPLVIMTPKSLLRHKLAVSPLADMADGSTFQPVIPEIDAIARARAGAARRAVHAARSITTCWRSGASAGVEDVAIVRLEQLYPVPGAARCASVLAPYPQRRGGLVPGGAGEHGRLDLRRPPDRDACCASSASRRKRPDLCRPRRGGEPGDRPRQDPCRAAGRAGRRARSALADRDTAKAGAADGDRDQGAHAGRERHHRDRGALAEEGGRGGRRRRAAGRAGDRQGDGRGATRPAAGVLGAHQAAGGRRGRGRRRARHAGGGRRGRAKAGRRPRSLRRRPRAPTAPA